jgi:hypothetical protein
MQVAVACDLMARLNSTATANLGAIVKVSRENLALAVLWGAIGACALMTLLAPTMTAASAEGSGLNRIMASLVQTAF